MRSVHTPTTFTVALALSSALACAPQAAAASDPQPLAKATLDFSITSATCTLTTPSGSSQVPCGGSSGWSGTLQPGWSVMVVVNVAYHYTDDGLLLPSPARIQTNELGGGVIATHESGVLYANVLPTCARSGCGIIPDITTNSPRFGPVFLSNNDAPEDVTGTATLSLTAVWPSNFAPITWSGPVGFFVVTGPVNSVTAIPEPATWVLMAVPLAALMLVRRRRAVRA